MKLKRNLKYGASALAMALLLSACGNNVEDASNKVDQQADAIEDSVEKKTAPVEEKIESKTDDIEDSVEAKVNDFKGIQDKEFAVSLDDAVTKFREEFPAEGVEITSVELDHDDDRYEYDIQGYDNENEYELVIDAESGEIISREEEQDDVDPDDLAIDFVKIISPEEAMAKALENNTGYVKSYELESEDGKLVYDIDVEEGDDVKLDAETGDILSK